ncbi:SAM-dependent methyltransferase [Micromonospora phytophila]|uniref:SAM-dependent methyltransferase n=1 Tax=Micromonospora phytophila TaxID=709888 RepID=UPI00202F975D|nr:SAM-dependent methyltransferase [Micromonospora phytophila]MCM0676798.1 SAM-dependent methyltransferase [Micromonospora phytophila]
MVVERTVPGGADRIDTSVPHPARRYNYWLGGKDNFQADRESGDAIAAAFPSVRTGALENRRFLKRVVSHLVRDAGIDQFLDIGTGIPSADNTHEVAQGIDPAVRVVYVDNDPIVLAHARALLNSAAEGATAYLDADLREPEKILSHPDLLNTIDLARPVGLMLVAVMHFVRDDEDPYGVVRRLVEALPSGSYVAMSHVTSDYLPPEQARQARSSQSFGPHGVMAFRTRDEVRRFFDGLEIVEPGIVSVAEWRAEQESGPRPTAAEAGVHCAVARKP